MAAKNTNRNRLGSTSSAPSKGRGPVRLRPEKPLEGTPLGAADPKKSGGKAGSSGNSANSKKR